MGSRLTEAAGASDFFKGSIVSYDSEVKFSVLGVPEGPVVSARAAEAMASGARARARIGRRARRHRCRRTSRTGRPTGGHGVHRSGDRRRRGARSSCTCPAIAGRIREFTAISALDLLRRRLLARGAKLRLRCGCSSRCGRTTRLWSSSRRWTGRCIDGVRWTTRDQWHITLRFFGEVDDAQSVEVALRDAGCARTTRCGAELGPTVQRVGNMLWAPVSGLDDIARSVVSATASFGAPPDDRRFRGHITLARHRSRKQGSVLRAAQGQPLSGSWDVREIELVRSHLGRGGSRYETLARVPAALWLRSAYAASSMSDVASGRRRSRWCRAVLAQLGEEAFPPDPAGEPCHRLGPLGALARRGRSALVCVMPFKCRPLRLRNQPLVTDFTMSPLAGRLCRSR